MPVIREIRVKIGEQPLLGPGPAFLALRLHRGGVAEILDAGGLPAEDPVQAGADAVLAGLGGVAGAGLVEDLLAGLGSCAAAGSAVPSASAAARAKGTTRIMGRLRWQRMPPQ